MEGDETAEPSLVKREGSLGLGPKSPSDNVVKLEGNDVECLVSMARPGTMVQAPMNVDGDDDKDARVPPPGVTSHKDADHADDKSDCSSELSEPEEYSDDEYVDPTDIRVASRQEKKEQQPAKAKPRTPRRAAKNVAEYAARLSASRKEAFLKYMLVQNDPMRLRGGIVADMPGFGKTIATLAAIHGNRPEKAKRDAGEGATLVVAPNASLARQWRNEILAHLGETYDDQTILMSTLQDGRLDHRALARKRIVIATYTELRMSYEATPSAHVYESDEDGDDAEPAGCVRGFPLGADEYAMADDYIRGMLHKVQFFRLVLDEVHNIKRHAGMTFRAAYAVQAHHKWGLSGTPLSNRIEELYSYTKLIGCTNITNFQEFKDVYVLSSDAKDRIDVLMTNNSYRRTDQDLFLGNRMMKLPQKHMEDQNVQLTAVEKAIQEQVL
ncbi:DNA repair protein rad5 like [Verticillium longisporum]|uniref:DNA repair protein rad5 like n=1 Tax=Verticillium longisporum TaxID=100787 RepID=A0A8I3AYE7_VERLO|nr:DNA repair protein rad5 like [Verticillium longisporum]